MPAINVAKTDTFEIQRQKINQLSEQLFSIQVGGSDLSTGNLKLGDGTREQPSLSFISDDSVGVYKSGTGAIGFVSGSKKLTDYSPSGLYSFRDLIVQQRILETEGVSVFNNGFNYDAGSYSDISLIGGTGDGAKASITVTEFDGEIINFGSNYNQGSYSNISLTGGSGAGATVSFSVEGIQGFISNGGSGYIPGSYSDVPLSGGSGSGATANITISGETILTGSITSAGSGYTTGSYSSVELLNKPTQIFVVTTTANPGTPPPDDVFVIDGDTQKQLTLIKGNTYRFDVSDSSNTGHTLIFQTIDDQFLSQLNYTTVSKGTAGQAGAFIDLIISPSAPTETVKYNSIINNGMGANISVTTGTVGTYGTNLEATITVNASGIISDLEFSSEGNNYKENDVLQVYNGDVGNSGSGFEFTLSAPTYTGEITSVEIQSSDQYYLKDDVLSTSNTNLGGVGSGFTFTIDNDPNIISDLFFESKGSGYETQDILELPKILTGIQTQLNGEVSGVATTLSTSSAVITVSDTTGILAGMGITQNILSDTGQLELNTTVLSVDSSTQITLSQTPTVAGQASLTFTSPGNLTEIVVSSIEGIFPDSLVTQTAGSGILASDTTVVSIDTETNTITLSEQPTRAGSATLSFTPPFGDPINNFEYEIGNIGVVESFSISEGGNGYSLLDVLTVNPFDLTQPITYPVINKQIIEITFVDTIPSSTFNITDILTTESSLIQPSLQIYKINESGGNITSLVIDSFSLSAGDFISKDSDPGTEYELATVSNSEYRYFIDVGFGFELTPNFTLYAGNTYNFDLSDSSNSSHIFSLSTYPGGIWGQSLIENISTTLSSTSNEIIVSDSSGILSGMSVSVISGSGTLAADTKVEEVNGNTITLSNIPIESGASILAFTGVEYTNGITRENDILVVKVSETTPNLYYYCATQDSSHLNEGGDIGEEALITISTNNPKTFGSGFLLTVDDLVLSDVITGNVQTGDFTAVKFIGEEAELDDVSVTGILSAPSITGDVISANSITSTGNLGITASSVDITGDLNIGSNIEISSSSGNIITSGVLQTSSNLNVNNILNISNNTISTTTGNNILLAPPTGRVTKIDATTALIIPSGTSAQRPSSNVVENGSIRFNTDTNQYEGYSATTTSWSSLGGVRDLDGNTYISAEAFTGANDNILYFFNDSNNTLKLSTSYLDFNTVKKIRSLGTSLPVYTEWSSNTPVLLGSFVKYRNNLYEVTTAGTTGTSGNEPTHTSGAQPNGTAELTWYISAVSTLTFEEIEELRVGPLGNLPLVINSDLRLADNVISTDISDIVIRPNSGKKVTIDAATSLVIPTGDGNSRGSASQGSIRYNTSILQFEGYDGSNWTSLGGVKDVDGNTYIIPETAPGANENTLYFYNDGENTLRLSKTALTFQTISTILSNSNSLAINASLITFDNLSSSIDNSGTSTFISSTKTNLDLGLSVGLTNKHLLRLNDSGDIIINRGFGTSIENNLVVLSNELKDFELEDTKLSTADINLIKGTTNTGSVVLYSPATASGIKVVVSAYNNTSNDVEMVEFTVTDKGSDIYNSEYGNIITSDNLINVTFDFNASDDVRMNFSLDDSVETGDEVNITVVKTIIKK